MRVLIVSDRALVKRSLRKQVERTVAGARLEMERSPLVALRNAVMGSPVGLAVLDLDTRGCRRMDWALKLRCLEPEAAVVTITALHDEAEAQRAQRADIAYLHKDAVIDRLGEVIRSALLR